MYSQIPTVQIKKIYLKPQKDVGKNELKLPRSGFVHHLHIFSFGQFVIKICQVLDSAISDTGAVIVIAPFYLG